LVLAYKGGDALLVEKYLRIWRNEMAASTGFIVNFTCRLTALRPGSTPVASALDYEYETETIL